jgi:hypothetical protein
VRRLLWTVGVGLVGFYIGGMGGGLAGAVVGFVWGAGIGYGLGSIITKKQATKRVLVYWGLTLALIGTFFGLVIGAPPEASLAKVTVGGAIGAVAGALLGLLVGTMHLRRLGRRTSQSSM